jgi:hypothetical protein
MSRRHCFGLLLSGTLLVAPGLSAAAPPARTATAPRGAAISRSVFDRLLDGLDQLWEARGGSGRGAAAAAPALHSVRGSSGCGIDPNGCH